MGIRFFPNTDDDDDADATGENLGKRNVYRKLSNSELPQRAAWLGASTCLLHCAAITWVCPSHGAPCVPHSEPHRPPHQCSASLQCAPVRVSTQTGCPYFAHYLQSSGLWWHIEAVGIFCLAKVKSLNCVGNPLHVTFFSAFLPLYRIVVQRILMGSRMRSHGWETTQLPLSPRHKIFFQHKFFVYTKYHMAGLKYGIRDACM